MLIDSYLKAPGLRPKVEPSRSNATVVYRVVKLVRMVTCMRVVMVPYKVKP